jgi:hypothetical protein
MAPEAQMGMADGGMVPPYAVGGGLANAPIPDDMFQETDNPQLAGGGLVAFAEGGDTLQSDFDAEFGAPSAQAGPTYYGYSASNPLANADTYTRLFGRPETKYTDAYEKELLAERTPEARKKARQTDLGYALMAMGQKIAETRGGLLQGIPAGFGAAAPILMQSAKERKAEEREIRKGLLDIEAGRNTAAAQKAAQLLQMQQMGIQGQEAEAGRKSAIELQQLKNRGDIDVERLRQAGEMGRLNARLGALRASSGNLSKPEKTALRQQAIGSLKAALAADKDMGRMRTPEEKKNQQAKIAGLIYQMSQAHNALQAAGDRGIVWNPDALANYNAYARQTRSWPVAPERKPRQTPVSSHLYDQADAIIDGS